jgi:excisionase family DNA binding protein
MDTFEKMYSPKEAGGPLSCSRDTVARLMENGQLGYVEFPRMGGGGTNKTRRIPESEIKRFLERNRGRRQ